LQDLWVLNLESNRWTQLLPYRRWTPRSMVAAVAHPPTHGVTFLTGSTKDDPSEASIHLWHGDTNQNPVRLSNTGDRTHMYRCWSLLREPESHDLWVFANEGVFTVRLEPV
jgi:hypothetical protein